ncbi:MAG TPA: GntR family transcriptional regulator [Candidatus Hydrogenedentes bacterium]|nr:GntR family transcriptional regulator [Candidatus Hydrogenedentota bacterium]
MKKNTTHQEKESGNGGGLGQTRSREIAERLTREIIKGAYPVGSKLPTERELAVEYDTNRNVIREALTRLEAVGLVYIRQGSGIYVDDMQFTSGIKLLDVLLRSEDGSVNLQFLKDVVEFRGQLMCSIVRLTAVRRTEEELKEIKRLAAARSAVKEDVAELAEVNLTMYRKIAAASHNQIFEFIFNTTGKTQIRLWQWLDLPLLGFDQSQRAVERILEAFEQKDGVMAELVLRRYKEQLLEALEGASSAQIAKNLSAPTVLGR